MFEQTRHNRVKVSAAGKLTAAGTRRKPDGGMIFHSVSGSQCASHASISTPTESFFNSLKNKRAHGPPYSTSEEAQADLF